MKKIIILMICSIVFQIPLQAASRKRTGNKLKIKLPKSDVKASDLLDAVQAGDKKQVKKIFDQHHRDLDAETINEAFVKTVTGKRLNKRPEITVLFLEHSEVKKKITGESLDKALISSLNNSLLPVYYKILSDPLFRKKLYCSKSTKERFEKVLKSASSDRRKKRFRDLISHPELYNKVKHLDFIVDSIFERQVQTPPQEKALFDAIKKNDLKTASTILTKNLQSFDKAVINKAFVKTMTGEKKNLRPEIALLFLKHPQIKKKINEESLDKAFIQSFRHSFEDLFLTIVQEPLFRKKLYTCKATQESFNKILKVASRFRTTLLAEFLFYPELYHKVQHLECITEEARNKALEYKAQEVKIKTDEEQALITAVEENDLQEVAIIFDESLEWIDESVINQAFIKTITGWRKDLKLDSAMLFLIHPEAKKKLHGKSLDKVFNISIRYGLRDLYSMLLQDSLFRSKLYTNNSTKKLFEKVLHYTYKRKHYFFEFLSYKELYNKVKHLDFISKQNRKDALSYKKRMEKIKFRSEYDHELLNAVEENNFRKVTTLLDKKCDHINKNTINEAIIKTVTGGSKKKFKVDITVLFLEHTKTKNKLKGKTLDKVLIRSIQYCLNNVFSVIVNDSILRKKLYTSKKTKEPFESTFKKITKKNKRLFLSYPDLHAKVEHLDFITKKDRTEALKQTKQVEETKPTSYEQQESSAPVKCKITQDITGHPREPDHIMDITEPFNPYELLEIEKQSSLFPFDFAHTEIQEIEAEESMSLFDNLIKAVQEQNLELLRDVLAKKDSLSLEELKASFVQASANEWLNGMFEFFNLEGIDYDLFVS